MRAIAEITMACTPCLLYLRVYDENPEIWHNRILRKKLGTSKMHAAGVFNQPKRETGQHFAIHPEWPTA